jgi:hypothetical protein
VYHTAALFKLRPDVVFAEQRNAAGQRYLAGKLTGGWVKEFLREVYGLYDNASGVDDFKVDAQRKRLTACLEEGQHGGVEQQLACLKVDDGSEAELLYFGCINDSGVRHDE